MLEFLKKQANITHTENGAVTYRSTNSHCLDLFATIGALRHLDDSEIISRFLRAYTEDPNLATKCLFYARDVRGGLGERRVFRTILHWLADNEPQTVIKNLGFVAEYGRFDDLLCLVGTACEPQLMQYIKIALQRDREAMEKGESVSLLAKWLPSVNASNTETVRHAKRIAKALGLTDAQYRKELVQLRAQIRIVENNLREKDYSFDYEKQPSKALFKYRKAFARNDHERYTEFLRKVQHGEAQMHTGTLTPYDIIAPFFRSRVTDQERRSIDVTWNSQEDFTDGENALVVIDGSGSMYGGGNHFIEVDRGADGSLYLVVHSGSRHLGNEVAKYYQDEGFRALCGNARFQIDETIKRMKAEGNTKEIHKTVKQLRARRAMLTPVPKDLAYVEGRLFDDYIHDMKIIQQFAALNRKAMVDVILTGMELAAVEQFTTIHNYIDTEHMILRKGAVSAQKGEKLLIPINMRDGSLICMGKGNEDWNCSAPHGAGRLMSRKQAFSDLSMEEFKAQMEGIYTTCILPETLDEAPMAYKNMDEIVENIAPTAEITENIKPIYNFKAAD